MNLSVTFLEYPKELVVSICLRHLGLLAIYIYNGWQWVYIPYLLVSWQMYEIFWRFWWKAPSGVLIAAYPTPFGRWLTALYMVFNAEGIVQNAYDQSNGKPFAVPMTDRWIIFVSDANDLKQLELEPESVLSMEQALHELAFTGPILGHLQVPAASKGPQSEAFRVMVGVLKNRLRSSIPSMIDTFRELIEEAVALEMNPTHKKSNAHGDPASWREVRVMPSFLRIFTRVNLLVFVGQEQAESTGVYDGVMSFSWSCARALLILNLVPGFIQPLVGPIAVGLRITRQRVYNLFLNLTRNALDNEYSDASKKKSPTITQWTADMTKLKDAVEIAKITLGLLFASAFQVPMIALFCIYNICKHPEYYEKLREEAIDCKDVSFGRLNDDMPYLDSFIRETSRLSPGILLSAPRSVMVPYTSPDGYHVPTGNWLAIPQACLMRDEKLWPNASQFQGFRFVDENGKSKVRLTHPSHAFPFWGAIRHACPARFYVSIVLKLILGHLMVNYEFKLVSPTARPYLTLAKTRLPNPFLQILIRKREVAELGYGKD